MVNLAVVGVGGRMGGAIVKAAQLDDTARVSVALEREGSTLVGSNLFELTGAGSGDVPVVDDIAGHDFDVLIDFSNPAASVAHAEFCQQHAKPIVIGTTGLSERDLAKLKAASAHCPVLFSRNMSVGVNLTTKLLEMAAKTLMDSVDVEIIEAHHRHKVDAPSGTALMMGEAVANASDRVLSECGVYAREGNTGERKAGSIGFSTVRGGDIAGEHTVLFIGESERIEISHKATDRMIFAYGAVRAAKWLAKQPNGLYDMQDVLGFR